LRVFQGPTQSDPGTLQPSASFELARSLSGSGGGVFVARRNDLLLFL